MTIETFMEIFTRKHRDEKEYLRLWTESIFKEGYPIDLAFYFEFLVRRDNLALTTLKHVTN